MRQTFQRFLVLLIFSVFLQAHLGCSHRFFPRRSSIKVAPKNIGFGLGKWTCRGGDDNEALSETNDDEIPDDDSTSPNQKTEQSISVKHKNAEWTRKTKKIRRTSEMVWDLRRRSGVTGNDESVELRELISNRSKEYIEELRLAVETNESKLPHPRKLLHYLAPKVPAIRQSPDINLRVHSARSDIDSGLAACIIGTLAHACEIYDQEMLRRADPGNEKPSSAAPELTMDRRFEQLIECVISGVNVKKRKKESLSRRLEENSEDSADIEEILDEENIQEDEGLKIRDSCRAAWGIAVLGAHHLDTLGGEKVLDLLLALSLRVREVLLARLQNLRQDDLLSETWMANLSPEGRLNELAEELAEDAVSCMWAFACVRACTGQTSLPLFETCCSILCQDPVAMRKRAQDGEIRSIGSSDVVHRLAHSETIDGMEVEATNTPEGIANLNKDAFLDWLSPTEINDVIWSLAVHGSSNGTSTLDEINLSETAIALREIAFDRILEWLEEDLKLNKEFGHSSEEPKHTHPKTFAEGDQITHVEVVDASALLASNENPNIELSGLAMENLAVENLTLFSDQHLDNSGEIQEVQVVDAARLLASQDNGEVDGFPTEVIVTSTPNVIHGNTLRSLDQSHREDSSDSYHEQDMSEQTMRRQLPLFTPHDLASMAWSVTELRDSLRTRIVGVVSELISRAGRVCMERMSSCDLSNLAWAISKHQDDTRKDKTGRSSLTALSVVQWIAQSAIEKIHTSSNTDKIEPWNALEVFQPPELGRLMWAIAYAKSSFSNISHAMKYDKSIIELAQVALDTAAGNLSLFGTEDLLRILWAFLELSEDQTGDFSTSALISLGRVLSTVEQSLHRWERGECHATAPEDPGQSTDSVFSSFFGRPRRNLSSLEYAFGDSEDDYGDALAHLLEKSQRPRLRDLSIDPSTLCKAACGFQRLARSRTLMKGGWTLTRVALRLLTSRDARLMKECSINDIVRICEAAALTDSGGHGRELMLGFFVRKLLQVINQSLEKDRKYNIQFDLSEASPVEVATLLWSLGELGARHSISLDAESRHLAYKRMRLVSGSAFLSKEDVKSLDVDCSIKLEVEIKARHLKSGEEICTLAETVAMLRDSLKPRKATQREAGSQLDMESDLAPVKETIDQISDSDRIQESSPGGDDLPVPLDGSEVENELWNGCGSILKEISSRVLKVKNTLTASEIRRILMVYSFLPFQADDLVEELGSEVSKRISLAQHSSTVSLENLIETSQIQSQAINSTLFEETSTSAFEAIKKGFISLFQSVGTNEEAENDVQENKLSDDLANLVQQTLLSTSEVSSKVHAWSGGSRASLDSLMRRVDESALFEYGRCRELIAHYYRIEFSTGFLRSRYDKERRKDIAKRVLSRLLP